MNKVSESPVSARKEAGRNLGHAMIERFRRSKRAQIFAIITLVLASTGISICKTSSDCSNNVDRIEAGIPDLQRHFRVENYPGNGANGAIRVFYPIQQNPSTCGRLMGQLTKSRNEITRVAHECSFFVDDEDLSFAEWMLAKGTQEFDEICPESEKVQ